MKKLLSISFLIGKNYSKWLVVVRCCCLTALNCWWENRVLWAGAGPWAESLIRVRPQQRQPRRISRREKLATTVTCLPKITPVFICSLCKKIRPVTRRNRRREKLATTGHIRENQGELEGGRNCQLFPVLKGYRTYKNVQNQFSCSG